jgi:hypothetical protein
VLNSRTRHDDIETGQQFNLVEITLNEAEALQLSCNGIVKVYTGDIVPTGEHSWQNGRLAAADFQSPVRTDRKIDADPSPVDNFFSGKVESTSRWTRLSA